MENDLSVAMTPERLYKMLGELYMQYWQAKDLLEMAHNKNKDLERRVASLESLVNSAKSGPE